MKYSLNPRKTWIPKTNWPRSSGTKSTTRTPPTLGVTPTTKTNSKCFVSNGTWPVRWDYQSGPKNIFDFSFINTNDKVKNFLLHDIIFVANQECGSSIMSTFCCGVNKRWNKKLINLLRPTHIPILNNFLNAIHSIVFVKKTYCLFPKSWLISCRKRHQVPWSGGTHPKQGLLSFQA